MPANEPKAMAEIHAIRQRQEKEMTGLTAAEQIAYIQEKADRLLRRYGLTLPRLTEPARDRKK